MLIHSNLAEIQQQDADIFLEDFNFSMEAGKFPSLISQTK